MAESPNNAKTWFMDVGPSVVVLDAPYITYSNNAFKLNGELLNQLLLVSGTQTKALGFRDEFVAGTIEKPTNLKSLKISYRSLS